MKQKHTYPPARWCVECRCLHNGPYLVAECCGKATVEPPDYLAPTTRKPTRMYVVSQDRRGA